MVLEPALERECERDSDRDPGRIICAASAACESNIAISAFSSNAGPDMHEIILSPNICCRQLFPGALIDRSWTGGRPGIVAGTTSVYLTLANIKGCNSRESMAISCTVVIGPNSGTLTFLRRTKVCSFGLGLAARSFSNADGSMASVSGLLPIGLIDSLSFAGNN